LSRDQNDTFALVLIGKKFIIADVCSFKELCCVDVLFSPTALAEHPVTLSFFSLDPSADTIYSSPE